jgi:hypothetical protein
MKQILVVAGLCLVVMVLLLVAYRPGQPRRGNPEPVEPETKAAPSSTESNQREQEQEALAESTRLVSPTAGLQDLMEMFEEEVIEEAEETVDLAAAIRYMLAKKKRGEVEYPGLKDPEYYEGLETRELAAECCTGVGLDGFEIVDDHKHVYIYHRLRILHNGFAELFKREDMWEGILHVYGLCAAKLDAKAKTAVTANVGGVLLGMRELYSFPPLAQQVKGREKMFLASTLRVLKRYKWFIEEFIAQNMAADGQSLGFWCEPCSVATLSLAFAKQVDRQKYARIEPACTSIRWTQRQNPQDMLAFLTLVVTSLDGFVSDDAGRM